MTLLRERKVISLLRRLYQSGKPFFGLFCWQHHACPRLDPVEGSG